MEAKTMISVKVGKEIRTYKEKTGINWESLLWCGMIYMQGNEQSKLSIKALEIDLLKTQNKYDFIMSTIYDLKHRISSLEAAKNVETTDKTL